MSSPDSFLSIKYHTHGNPKEVLQPEFCSIDGCKEGEVIVKFEAATIHPSDIGLINGSYGNLNQLPCSGGREGVGVIHSVGKGVDENLLGRPVCLPSNAGVWQEFFCVKVESLLFLPSLVPLDQLAVSVLNPMTAWRLLNDFEYLKNDDVIIQNAGNSSVGLSVIQFAKILGVRCISLVRGKEKVEKLSKLTDCEVFEDNDDVFEKIVSITKGRKCSLALNSVGGRSSLRLARCLKDGGVHVTFGAMDSSPIRFPTRNLIFNDIRFVGFWLDRWKRKRSRTEIRAAMEDVLQPLALTQIIHQIDSVFELKDYLKAIERNEQSRLGKVLLVRPGSKLIKFKGQAD